MLNGMYCDVVGDQVSHLCGFHSSTSGKPTTASLRCAPTTEITASWFENSLRLRQSSDLTDLVSLENGYWLLSICSATHRQERVG